MSIQTLSNKLLIAVFLSVVLSSCSEKKTAYVDIFTLVSEFELQKEYSAEAKRALAREREKIDSLVYLETFKNPSGNEYYKNELYADLYRRTEERTKEIESMIWKRLNPYLTDFGKEKGYQYIYGANGTGNVLYADKNQDITAEVIEYVNRRYHGGK